MTLRHAVLARDWACRGCGAPGQDRDYVDHIVPLADGGGDDLGNLQRLCRACSARKTGREAARGRR